MPSPRQNGPRFPPASTWAQVAAVCTMYIAFAIAVLIASYPIPTVRQRDGSISTQMSRSPLPPTSMR